MSTLLRSDLSFSSPGEGENGKYIVQDPISNEIYEFGEEEYYILQEIRKPYHDRVLLTKFNAKFGENAGMEYIREFLSTLNSWGLLEGGAKQPENEDIVEALPVRDRDRANHWSWFCPQAILDRFAVVFRFLRHLVKIVPFLAVVALLAWARNSNEFHEDLGKVAQKFNFFEHLIYTLFTLNLITVTVKGCIARAYNLPTPSFGIMLADGGIPRFDIPIDITKDVDRTAKLWLYAAAMLVRFLLISLGIIIWSVTRNHGTSLSIWNAALVQYGVLTLLFIANPFLGADGYKFLTTYFDIQNLRQKANRSLKFLFSPPPKVIRQYHEHKPAIIAYGVLSIITTAYLVYFIAYSLSSWLESNYRGFGVALFLLFVFYLVVRARILTQKKKDMKAARMVRLRNGADRDASAGKPIDKFTADGANTTQKSISALKAGKKKIELPENLSDGRVRKYLFAIFFILLMFVPYRYEPGGSVEVQPVLHQEIYAEDKGIVETIYFNGGEWLKKGTIIAEMEHSGQRKDFETTDSEIRKKKEEINVLLTTPSKEEVELARQQLESAKVKLEYSEANYLKIKGLYEKESQTLAKYLEAKEQRDVDQQEVLTKKASLLALEKQVNVHELESVKIELTILEQELQYFAEKLEKTKLRMPNDGKIVTMNLKNLEGKFFEEKALVMEIEDATKVRVEISIPESDVRYVKVGNGVRLRSLLNPNKSIQGVVSLIHPVTESADYGKIVKVVCIIPNEDFVLKTGMTGEAKIEGEKMFLVQAFTKALVSFILIECWSWLP